MKSGTDYPDFLIMMANETRMEEKMHATAFDRESESRARRGPDASPVLTRSSTPRLSKSPPSVGMEEVSNYMERLEVSAGDPKYTEETVTLEKE